MPRVSVTTTVNQIVFAGSTDLESLMFSNSSTAGIIYLLNKANSTDTVSSTVYDRSLSAGQSVGFTRLVDGAGSMEAAWSAVSDTGGGVILEILPIYRTQRVH